MKKIYIIILIFFILSLSQYIKFSKWDFDDGFIVYRIVDNIVSEQQWAFNLNENYNPSTSVLNPFIISVFSFFYRDIQVVAHILESVWIFFSSILIYFLFKKRYNNIFSIIPAIVYIFISANDPCWGLEIHLSFFLMLLFVFCEANRKFLKYSWYILGFIVLSRPDGIVLVVFKFLKEYIVNKNLTIKGIFKFLIIILPWLIFSLIKFKQFFPDSIKQKIWQGTCGFWGPEGIYFISIKHRLFFSGIFKTLIFILVIVSIYFLVKHKNSFLYLIGFVFIQQLTYIILNVPPCYEWYFSIMNYCFVILALYSLFEIIKILAKKKTIYFKREIYIIYIILFISIYYFANYSTNYSIDYKSEAYKKASEIINEHKGKTLSAVEVGTLSYFTKRKIIDICGLTTMYGEFITGERNNKFFELLPDNILMLYPKPGNQEKAIFNDIRFKKYYKQIEIINFEQFPLQLFKKR